MVWCNSNRVDNISTESTRGWTFGSVRQPFGASVVVYCNEDRELQCCVEWFGFFRTEIHMFIHSERHDPLVKIASFWDLEMTIPFLSKFWVQPWKNLEPWSSTEREKNAAWQLGVSHCIHKLSRLFQNQWWAARKKKRSCGTDDDRWDWDRLRGEVSALKSGKGLDGCWTKNRGGKIPPKWMVKIMENPMRMLWGGVPPILG